MLGNRAENDLLSPKQKHIWRLCLDYFYKTAWVGGQQKCTAQPVLLCFFFFFPHHYPYEVCLKFKWFLLWPRVSLTFEHCGKWDKFVTRHKQTEKPSVSFMLKCHCLPRRDQLSTEMFNGAIRLDTGDPCVSSAGLKSCLLYLTCMLASAKNNPNSVNKEKNHETMNRVNGIHGLLQNILCSSCRSKLNNIFYFKLGLQNRVYPAVWGILDSIFNRLSVGAQSILCTKVGLKTGFLMLLVSSSNGVFLGFWLTNVAGLYAASHSSQCCDWFTLTNLCQCQWSNLPDVLVNSTILVALCQGATPSSYLTN